MSSLAGVRLSPWIIVDEFCATRIVEGGEPDNIADRRAFIEKSPRILLNGEWIYGPKGSGGSDPERQGTNGFDLRSRAWADDQLRAHGAFLPEDPTPS